MPQIEVLDVRERARLLEAIRTAGKAIKEHQVWLETSLLPAANANFRAGAEIYDQKLAYSLNTNLSRQDVGQKTFYAISPIPEDWDEKQVLSFLREYNLYSMQDLTIHEAVPGHYLQLAHSSRYPSTLRAVLGKGTTQLRSAIYLYCWIS